MNTKERTVEILRGLKKNFQAGLRRQCAVRPLVFGFRLTAFRRRLLVASAAILVAFPILADRQEFSRYQSIVDRQMFGQPPPGFDPTKPPSEVSAKEERAKEQELTKEQEQLKSSIHFSMINETPSGETAVGFTDNSDSKNPKHYYLKVGESRDGWTVKEADALKAEMTIVKGEIEVTLTIGGNSANGGTKKAGAASGRPGASASAMGGRPNLLGGRLGGRSIKERNALKAQQRAEEARIAAEEKARAAEEREREKAEREAEKAEREKEREEQRAQLMQIQEELKKAREEKEKAEAEKSKGDGEKEGDDE